MSFTGAHFLLSSSGYYLYVIGLFLHSFTFNFCCFCTYSPKLSHSSASWSKVKSDSSSVFWFIYSWSICWIVGTMLSFTTLITWCKMLYLTPEILNIPSHMFMSLLKIPISVFTRINLVGTMKSSFISYFLRHFIVT